MGSASLSLSLSLSLSAPPPRRSSPPAPRGCVAWADFAQLRWQRSAPLFATEVEGVHGQPQPGARTCVHEYAHVHLLSLSFQYTPLCPPILLSDLSKRANARRRAVGWFSYSPCTCPVPSCACVGVCLRVCVCGAEHVRDGQATLADFAHGDYPESGSKTMGGPSALERVLGHVKAAL